VELLPHERPRRVLDESLVDPERDLLARRQAAPDEVLADDFAREIFSHISKCTAIPGAESVIGQMGSVFAARRGAGVTRVSEATAIRIAPQDLRQGREVRVS